MPRRLTYALVGIGVIAVAVLVAYGPRDCSPIPSQAPTKGSHGYRIWSGPTLKSFDPGGKKICIPRGWEAVGATATGPGWAEYQPGMTGVAIRSSEFASTSLTLTHSAYRVTIRYPIALVTPALLAEYERIVTNAFERTGAEFGDTATNPARTHTVLVTAGIAGAPYTEDNSVYPDPGPNVSFFILTPDHDRAEEYVVHAITHLYNRHRKDLIAYENSQSPVPAGDWQEMEATWAETAFRTSDAGRTKRLEYLYNVHTAVRTNDFSLIIAPPFSDDPAGFKKIVQTITPAANATYLDDQYDHYILAPLVMVATEGLLQKYKTGTDIEQLLTELHTGKIQNFFGALATLLPPSEIKHIQSWMAGTATVPKDLVMSGGHHYDLRIP